MDGVVTDEQDRAVARAIIDLGRTLDMKIVAEGLETADQVGVLAGLDCPLGQGFHFSRPLPAHRAAELAAGGAPALAEA